MSKVETVLVPAFDIGAPAYEDDYCAWLSEQARRLRSIRIPGVDSDRLAEEIESLVSSDRRQLGSRLMVLLQHLLKWRYQPARAERSWQATITEQRFRIGVLLRDSPSLGPQIEQALAEEYPLAVARAAEETGLRNAALPPACEWAAGDVLAEDFYPDPAG